MNAKERISVWLDETSDDHGLIVSLDDEDGSETLKTFPADDEGYRKALAAGKEIAAKRGLTLVEE